MAANRDRHGRDRRPRRGGDADACSTTAGASSCRGSTSASSSASTGDERLDLVQADLFDAEHGRPTSSRSRRAPTLRRASSTSSAASPQGGRVHETPVDDFERQFRLNLRPTYLVTRGGDPAMLAAAAARSSASPRAPRCSRSPAPPATSPPRPRVLAFVRRARRRVPRRRHPRNAILPSRDRHARQPRVDARRRPRRVGHARGDRAASSRFLCSDDAARDQRRRTSPYTAAHDLTRAASDRRWWTLGAVCVATFMLLLDITIVNVALPDIAQGPALVASPTCSGSIDAYALSLAALLLTAGSLADLLRAPARVRRRPRGLHGRLAAVRRSSTSPLVPRLARGAAGRRRRRRCSPRRSRCSRQAFQGRERGTAFGVWGATIGAAVAVGPLVGGVLTETVGWESIFLVNVPIGIAAIAVDAHARRRVARPGRRRRRLGRARDVLAAACSCSSSRSCAATPRAGGAR